MSHFTVLVIGEDVDGQLARFEENTQNLPEEWLEFKDQEEENRAQYENESMEVLVLSNGDWAYTWDDKFLIPNRDFLAEKQYLYPAGSHKAEKPYKELFSDYEDFLTEYHGLEKDEKMNKYGYWTNPQAHWDWYSVGGRWSGYFKLKPGARGMLGRPGVFDNVPKAGYVDSCYVRDLDYVGMQQDAIKDANETYDKIESVTKGRILPSWTETLERHGEGNIQAAREEYHSNPLHGELREVGIETWGGLRETFCASRAEYLAKMANSTLVTFAVVKDGKWYEKGEMGWFGMSHNEKEEGAWETEFWNLLKSLSENTLLTVVDCHI